MRELQGGWDEEGEWLRQRQLKWWDGGAQGELTGRYQGRGWELEVAQEWELEPKPWEQERESETREQEREAKTWERELETREWEREPEEWKLGERELEGQGNGRERHHPPPITPTRPSGTRGRLIQSSSSSSGEELEGME